MIQILALLLVQGAATSSPQPHSPPHANYRLQYTPSISQEPVTTTFLRESTNKAGRLYEITSTSNYSSPVQIIKLTGSPASVGNAYGELLRTEIEATYNAWYSSNPSPHLLATLDWLFNCSLRPQSPQHLLDELNGVLPAVLRTKLTRVLTGSTMPMDPNNIQTLIERGIAAHGSIGDHCVQSGQKLLQQQQQVSAGGLTHHCDFFAAWGSTTKDGRLLSTRNLDIKPGTGISQHKLVAIYDLDTEANVYATVGFAGYIGALAGMSNEGITVSEANLDNGEVSFDGIAWPMRLRQILGTAQNLTQARTLWHSQPNTAAFNFLLASGKDQSAVALETNAKYTSEFFANSSTEALATFSCIDGTVTDGHACHWPNNGGAPVRIGKPSIDAVFRSNHGMSPDIMRTQEPLWNDTVMRYLLLSDRIEDVRGSMDVEEAVGVLSLLGIKGEDYGSCAPANFLTGDPTHVLSILYDPTREDMYVAWEEGNVTKGDHADWRPAACNEYVWLNMSEWW